MNILIERKENVPTHCAIPRGPLYVSSPVPVTASRTWTGTAPPERRALRVDWCVSVSRNISLFSQGKRPVPLRKILQMADFSFPLYLLRTLSGLLGCGNSQSGSEMDMIDLPVTRA